MKHENERRKPFSESNLESPEYRERLMRKLNTLIAVLEVAAAKVRRSMQGPSPDLQRLTRIKKNLQETLDVCLRARKALERRGRISADLSKDLAKVNPELASSARILHELEAQSQSLREDGPDVEMSSTEERERFEKMGSITPEMVWTCDIDELCTKLQP